MTDRPRHRRGADCSPRHFRPACPGPSFGALVGDLRCPWTARLLLLLLLCVLTRVPAIHDPGMLLTGDEAVVGLMSRRLLEGRDVSFYFYGQHYAFTGIESLAGAAAFGVAGARAAALKWAMLTMFLGATFLFASALRSMAGDRAAGWGTLLFLCLPPWTLWSLQARGGYLTALLCACGILWVGAAAYRNPHPRPRHAVLLVLLSATVLVAKPVWLPGLLPVLAAPYLRRRAWPLAVGVPAAAALAALAAHLFFIRFTHAYWHAPALIGGDRLGEALRTWPVMVRFLFTTDLFAIRPDNVFYSVTGWAWILWMPVGLALQVRRLVRKQYCPWAHLLCLAVVLTLLASLAIPLQPRYLLPLPVFLVAWATVEAADLARRPRAPAFPVAAAGWVLAGVGLAGVSLDRVGDIREARRGPPARAQLERLIDLLRDEGIRHTYSTNPLLQWQVVFYSREDVLSRWTHPVDRVPEIPAAVDQALFAGEPTALIGPLADLPALEGVYPDRVYAFPDLPYFIAPDPDPDTLRAIGFTLHAPGSPRRSARHKARAPGRISPMIRGDAPAPSRASMAVSASPGRTTATIPIPMLKTRNISSSSTPPSCRMNRNTGGTRHVRGST